MTHPIWITPLILEDVNLRAKKSLSEHLGIQFTEVGNDFLTATMPVDHRTVQPMGIMHGGASCALAETVGSAYCVDQNLYVCVGLDININHIRPVKSGSVKGIARPIHLGKKTQVWEIKIFNEQNKIVSVSRLTLAVLEKQKGSSEDF